MKSNPELHEMYPGFFVRAKKRQKGLQMLLRRLRQLENILFSKYYQSSQSLNEILKFRFSSANEVEHYAKQYNVDLIGFEKQALQKALNGNYLQKSVLIVGCGGGREAFALEKMGMEVTAIDISMPMIDAAKKQPSSVDFQCCDFLNFESRDKFDLIFVSYTIESHIQGQFHRQQFFHKIKSHMKADSKVISAPEIGTLPKYSHIWLASFLLRIRWGKSWEKGDTLRSQLGFHNDDPTMVFYHYFPSNQHYQVELSSVGFHSELVHPKSEFWISRIDNSPRKI